VAQRKIIKVAITESAKAAIEAVASRHDMKEIAVASRVYEWFASQPDVVQKGVLRLLPEGYEAEVIRLALDRLVPAGQNLVSTIGKPGRKSK